MMNPALVSKLEVLSQQLRERLARSNSILATEANEVRFIRAYAVLETGVITFVAALENVITEENDARMKMEMDHENSQYKRGDPVM